MSNWLQSDKLSNYWSEKLAFKTWTTFPSSTACSRRVWPLEKYLKNALWHIVLQWSSVAYLLGETWLDESEESIYVGWFKRDTRPNVFHDLFTNSCGHEAHHVSDVDRKWYQMSLDLLFDILPCCLALDGTGMLLNSFTSLTLADRRKQWWHLILTSHILTIWCQLSEMLLTSCLSWVWRYMVSAFHCAEEWTSSGDTWEGMQSGPVGSECLESGRKNVCGKVYKELLSLF